MLHDEWLINDDFHGNHHDDQLGRSQPNLVFFFTWRKLGNPSPNQPSETEIWTDVEVAAVGCSRDSELK